MFNLRISFLRLFIFPGLVLWGLLSTPAWASVSVTGHFIAHQDCPAYVSKQKKTNPDDIRLEAGQSYSLVERNKAEQADWFRLDLGAHGRRWVHKDCGRVTYDKDSNVRVSQCRTKGLTDAYILAFSWQYAFCESRPDKPECKEGRLPTGPDLGFSLHGLWPQQNGCDKNYAFCGEVKRRPKHFCDYPAVSLDADTRGRLATHMPGSSYGSCLQRHEWHKHGSCQGEWSADRYYDISLDLLEAFNRAGIAEFMRSNLGQRVSSRGFFRLIDRELGEGAHQRMQFICNLDTDKLVEVRVKLPAHLQSGQALADNLAAVAPRHSNNCGSSFVIDDKAIE